MKLTNFHTRFWVSVGLAALVALVLPPQFHWATRMLCLWDTGMVSFLGLAWFVMLRATPNSMRRNAEQQDLGRGVILAVLVAAACASISAIVFMLKSGKQGQSDFVALHLTLAIVTIVGSWLLVHTIFAFHYAHEYYRRDADAAERSDAGGLDFPSDAEPDYWDFLYYSFVIGMTSQVSDVEIHSREMRRLTLLHSVLAFFFNTSILAMSINILASLF